MDVFIPEDYVIKRRIEREKAKSSDVVVSKKVSGSAGNGNRKEKKKPGPPSALRLDHHNEFLVSTGPGDNIVFSCFSA
ncbi:hypothetical protein FNV43_RR09252 [Rhamnella rubrinervis]|uniref:Uncharacterized protein n=1 Tax=Rhamnella rubrinervis TaxID=2594499 RepID=A0A8K0HAC1_9ROSA|nr:hypothetical protein FNV43_RR09252 [Rhamnella rubrinervis]